MSQEELIKLTDEELKQKQDQTYAVVLAAKAEYDKALEIWNPFYTETILRIELAKRGVQNA